MKFKTSKDYPLPNLFYFLPNDIARIRNKINKICKELEKSGFQECHLPFLIPKAIINTYQDLVPIEDSIKAYSGKNREAYAYLRPNGIFSQGLTLASKIIKSYKDLPLKLFELSPAYKKIELKQYENMRQNIFNSPEQAFSVQGAVFSEGINAFEELENLIEEILINNSISYKKRILKYKKTRIVQFVHKNKNGEILLGEAYFSNQDLCKNNGIYFFNKKGDMTFPYVFSFSISQNVIFLKI